MHQVGIYLEQISKTYWYNAEGKLCLSQKTIEKIIDDIPDQETKILLKESLPTIYKQLEQDGINIII